MSSNPSKSSSSPELENSGSRRLRPLVQGDSDWLLTRETAEFHGSDLSSGRPPLYPFSGAPLLPRVEILSSGSLSSVSSAKSMSSSELMVLTKSSSEPSLMSKLKRLALAPVLVGFHSSCFLRPPASTLRGLSNLSDSSSLLFCEGRSHKSLEGRLRSSDRENDGRPRSDERSEGG